MKKIISILISLAMLTSFLPMMSVSAEETTTEETTNVVWIGGSYAAGAGHSEKTDAMPSGVSAMPFAKQVTNWMAENSEETVNYYNVAVGGTQSTYGRNRFEKDVLSKDPDIVFIEFTGNDDSSINNSAKISMALEGMVRAVQTYEKENNKEVKIAFLYRPWFSSSDGAAYNLNRSVIDVYHAIADYYDVYEIDAAEEAKNLWEADGVEYSTMVSSDGAHPSALGHYYIGKAMINILKENPVTDQQYRSLPMNVEYTEISPTYIDASDTSYIDSENTTGFTADGTNMVSQTADDAIVYNFKGTSIGVVTESVSAQVYVYVDGEHMTNFSSGTAQALAHTQVLADGEHTLKIENKGGGKVTINNIIVDGIANGTATAKEDYERSIYEDTCMSTDALEGRTLTNTRLIDPAGGVSYYSGLYRNYAIGVYAHTLNNRFARYQLSGTTGFGENSNITNVDINYLEYTTTGQKTARKDFVVRAIDKDNNVLKIFDSDDCVYELDSTYSVAWKRFVIKVYNVPTNATGIEIYAYNSSNAVLTNVKIAYSDITVDSVSLNVPNLVSLNETAETSISQFTSNGQTEALTADAAVSYSSSNDAVATVDESGVISGIAEGTAEITATVTIGEDVFTDTKSVKVRDIRDYSDTAPKAIPENLITSGMAIDGQNTAHINRSNTAVSGAEMYTVAEIPEDEVNNIWYVFGGASIAANLNGGKYLNLNNYEAGTTYVYQAKVKNTSEDSSLVPHYGIANTNNTHGYKNAVGSNIYGKTGMPVTSTEWVNFRDTITYSDSWDETKTGYLGQTLIQGIATTGAPVGASLAVMKNAVDTSVEGSMEEKSLYFAEEAAHDLTVAAVGREDVTLGKYGSVTFKAEVLNQLELTGKLDQNVEWVVLSQDRTEIIDSLKLDASGNTATVSHDGTTPAGTYVIVAFTDNYDMRKGFEFEVSDSVDYHDTAAKEIPENLITSGLAIDGQNSGYITRNNQTSGEERYTVNTVAPSDNVYTFHGASIKARINQEDTSKQYVNLDAFEAGKTYVFQSMVKRVSGEDAIPYYGVAHPNNKGGNGNNIGSNKYGKIGMAVTSTDWMLFRDTITYPDTYDSTKTNYNGQVLYQGAQLANATMGAAVAVKKDAVDTTVEGSMETDGLYLAEETVHDLVITALNSDDEDVKLTSGSTVKVKAEVVNQIEIPGTLNQTISWVITDSSRTATVDTIDMDMAGNIMTISCDDTTPAGKYAVVAISETYGMIKSMEFEVVNDNAVKYKDYALEENPENLITAYQVVNRVNYRNNGVTSTYANNNTELKLSFDEGYTIDGTKWNVLGGTSMPAKLSGARADGTDARTTLNTDAFKAGKTYVFKTKVKRNEIDTSGTANGTPVFGLTTNQSYSLKVYPNEYGKEGKAITSTEYEDYAVTMTFPTSWSETSSSYEVGQVMFIGMYSNSTAPSSLSYTITPGEDTFYLAEEVLKNISNEIVSGETTINAETTLTLKSELTNQLGLKGGLNQEVTWVALTEDRSEVVDSITITEDAESGNATVSVTENTPAGSYVIVAYSEEYKAAKGIEITVEEKKTAKAEITLSQDAGYTWMTASVENAECENVTFIIAAYSEDANGNLTLLKVTTQKAAVTDGMADISELWLGGEDYTDVPSGTVVKAFVWESDSQKPVELTDDSIANITIE